MACFLQRMGYGDLPFVCYERAEAAFENALAVAAESAKFVVPYQRLQSCTI
jgi:hypothetical protein